MANSLQGRVAVIFGLANKRSIAWAIAQKLHAEGAQIAITYQNERLRQRCRRDDRQPAPARTDSNATSPRTRRSPESSSRSARSTTARFIPSFTRWPLLPPTI